MKDPDWLVQPLFPRKKRLPPKALTSDRPAVPRPPLPRRRKRSPEKPPLPPRMQRRSPFHP